MPSGQVRRGYSGRGHSPCRALSGQTCPWRVAPPSVGSAMPGPGAGSRSQQPGMSMAATTRSEEHGVAGFRGKACTQECHMEPPSIATLWTFERGMQAMHRILQRKKNAMVAYICPKGFARCRCVGGCPRLGARRRSSDSFDFDFTSHRTKKC